MNNNPQIEDILKIMDGETFSKLIELSQTVPIDVNNSDELKGALTTCLIELSNALDNGGIKFEKTKIKECFTRCSRWR